MAESPLLFPFEMYSALKHFCGAGNSSQNPLIIVAIYSLLLHF